MLQQNLSPLKARGMLALLEWVFWRKPSHSLLASELLGYVKRRQDAGDPMRVSEWSNYIVEHGITQSAYYDLIRKLRGAGMIRRERGTYKLSGDFSSLMRLMAEVWDAKLEELRYNSLTRASTLVGVK